MTDGLKKANIVVSLTTLFHGLFGVMCRYSRWNSEMRVRAFGSATMRIACVLICAGVDSWPLSEAWSSIASGVEPHSMYDRREAISWLDSVYWLVPAGCASDSSLRCRNDGDTRKP